MNMKRLLILALLGCCRCWAQTPGGQLTSATVSQLSGIASQVRSGYVLQVTDSLDGTCTTGGGSTKVVCKWDGSVWAVVGGSSIVYCGGGVVANCVNRTDSSGNESIGTSVPAGAPIGSAIVAGSWYGDASQLSGIARIAPARVQLAWSPGSVSAGTCNTRSVPFPGAQKNGTLSIGVPTDLVSGLQATVAVTSTDIILITVCNATSGSLSGGSGVGWVVTRN